MNRVWRAARPFWPVMVLSGLVAAIELGAYVGVQPWAVGIPLAYCVAITALVVRGRLR